MVGLVMADDFSLTGYGRTGASHPNPAYDYLTGFAPRKIKDLFRWVEYLFYNSPAIFAAVQKFAAYVVTEIKFEGDNASLKDNWEELLVHRMRIKEVGMQTNADRRIYGNSFISVYKPFHRFLVCEKCKGRTNIDKCDDYKFQLKTLKFKYKCGSCGDSTVGTAVDDRVPDKSRIRIIRWDPKLMDIDYNPITGQSEYYYTIPGDLQNKVERNNKHTISTMPMEFLMAIRDKKKFKFRPGQIFHMKTTSPAGIDSQWGLPPLTSTIKLFFYAAVLRKANEAIALDYIVPFRVLHPAPISGTADPATQLNLATWQGQLSDNIKKWRRDPLHIMFAPTALSVTTMGGQARSLMTLGEIKDAEDSIIAALGIPREFVYGGLTVTGSAISLRMLENQLETDANDMNDQAKWIMEQVGGILNWKTVPAKYIPFRMVDDSEQKGLIMQLNQATGGALSKSTQLAPFNIDLKAERDTKMQEAIDDLRSQLETDKIVQKLQNSASQQAQQAAQQGQGLGYNPQAVLAQADGLAQQLQQADPSTRQSQMDQLSQEDPVMYAVVKDRMETMAQNMRQQAIAQAKQQGGA